MVQSPDWHFFDLISSRSHFRVTSESTVIAMLSTPIRRTLAAHIGPIASSMTQRRNVATRGGKLANWLPLLLAMTTAADGWLALGPLAQSALIGAAVLRRLSGRMSGAYRSDSKLCGFFGLNGEVSYQNPSTSPTACAKA
jgi:hypothetical protein